MVGGRVEARWGASINEKRNIRFYPGVVDEVEENGHCAILYDDGDYEVHVPLHFVRPSSKRLICEEAEFAEVVSASIVAGRALRRSQGAAASVGAAVPTDAPSVPAGGGAGKRKAPRGSKRTAREEQAAMDEEADLQLALALSASEADASGVSSVGPPPLLSDV